MDEKEKRTTGPRQIVNNGTYIEHVNTLNIHGTNVEMEEPEPAEEPAVQDDSSGEPPPMPAELDKSIFKHNYDGKPIDFEKLWETIYIYYVRFIKHKYEWYGLYKLLDEKHFLVFNEHDAQKFCNCMRQWYPTHAAICSYDEIKLYTKGYTVTEESGEWTKEGFLATKNKYKQSVKGIENLIRLTNHLRPYLTLSRMTRKE